MSNKENQVHDQRSSEEILLDVIQQLSNPEKKGKLPTQAVELLSLWLQGSGVEQDTVTTLIGSDARSAASRISNLNGRYLEEKGIRVVGQIVYRLEKIDSEG
jgi:hypothetical protein